VRNDHGDIAGGQHFASWLKCLQTVSFHLESRNVRIAVRYAGSEGCQQLDNFDCRRFAAVADVLLVGDSKNVHVRAPHGLTLLIQEFHSPCNDESRHTAVNLVGKADESRLKTIDFRLPFQIKGIDWYAMAAQPGPRIERHKSERF